MLGRDFEHKEEKKEDQLATKAIEYRRSISGGDKGAIRLLENLRIEHRDNTAVVYHAAIALQGIVDFYQGQRRYDFNTHRREQAEAFDACMGEFNDSSENFVKLLDFSRREKKQLRITLSIVAVTVANGAYGDVFGLILQYLCPSPTLAARLKQEEAAAMGDIFTNFPAQQQITFFHDLAGQHDEVLKGKQSFSQARNKALGCF